MVLRLSKRMVVRLVLSAAEVELVLCRRWPFFTGRPLTPVANAKKFYRFLQVLPNSRCCDSVGSSFYSCLKPLRVLLCLSVFVPVKVIRGSLAMWQRFNWKWFAFNFSTRSRFWSKQKDQDYRPVASMSPLSAHELGFKETKHNCAAIWWLDVGNHGDHSDKNKQVRSELKITYR